MFRPTGIIIRHKYIEEQSLIIKDFLSYERNYFLKFSSITTILFIKNSPRAALFLSNVNILHIFVFMRKLFCVICLFLLLILLLLICDGASPV